MIHARADYDAIQPWPTKRPHIVKIEPGETADVTQSIYYDTDEKVAEAIEIGYIAPLIPDDEPVLLIRGQDLAAIPTAEAWCAAAQELGAAPSLIEAVERHIDLIRAWQENHAKVPDAPADVLR